MPSPNHHVETKVKLNLSIVAIAALCGAMILPFFFRRRQKPTQPIEQIDTTPIKQAISELTREVHDTKLVIEKMPEDKVPFRQKLGSGKYYTPAEVIQIIIEIIGLDAVIISLIFTYREIQANTKSLDFMINQNIMSQAVEVDRLFIDSPDLRPYFFDHQDILPSDKNYQKAQAVADYQLDFFATFFDQSGDWQVFQNDPGIQQAWDNYMDASFQQSPIMCHQLKLAED